MINCLAHFSHFYWCVFKRVAKLCLKKEKNVHLLKLKSYLGRLQDGARHAILLRNESLIQLLDWEQLFSSKHLSRTTPRTIKLGAKSLWQRMLSWLLHIWSFSRRKEELFVKLAVTKSLKTCEGLFHTNISHRLPQLIHITPKNNTSNFLKYFANV